MAIRFMDSFSHYATANIMQKWTSLVEVGNGNRQIVVGGGRCKQNALQLSANTIGAGDGPGYHCPFLGLTEGVLECGFRIPGGNDGNPAYIFAIYNAGLDHGRQIAGLGVMNNGTLVQIRGFFGGSSIITTSAQAIQDNSWHHIALAFKMSTTVGRFVVYVDGDLSNPWIDFTGNTGGNVYTDFSVLRYNGLNGGGTTMQMCDFFWGDQMSDLKGDTRVYARLPNADGATLQWTPLSGTSHFAMVDENPPDAGVTLNSNTPLGTGNIDTYQFPTIGIPSGTVYAVQVVPMLSKSDVGFRSAATVIRQGGINYTNATAMAVADGQYLWYPQCYNQDPTGASWTVVTAVSDEFGIAQTG